MLRICPRAVSRQLQYSEIKVVLNSDFFPKGMIFKNIDDEGFTIELKDISTGERITPGIFNFDVPADAQVVKNPLDIR